MGAVRFGVDDIVNVRFAISPLWETLASYRAVLDPGLHVIHLPWLRSASTLLRDADLAERTAPLKSLVRTPPPRCPLAEIEEELALLAPAPGLADAVRAWWAAGVQPYWPRIRAVLEADIAYRARQLAEDGIREVFAGLNPALTWSGDTLLSPHLPEPAACLDGAGITLVPTAFAVGCRFLTGDGPGQPALLYPTRAVGTLWERREPADDSLARLLGRSRARLLALTSSPATTTQLAARTGLSPGAVSQHLAVLRAAGLVTSHRYRREVNYVASDLAVALLERGGGPVREGQADREATGTA
ncbi:ArsR/SmtB family transcription factor [Streptomyces cinerochromogenes]|uniref:ArsR/SmtB family transcription factor n=1 Tax=Streptomyces cinerochromogenes TaxID=66422 RepID=UPI0016700A7C|nr:ArsR family transcriptional regulator [Streptomyces cinerochromogenes]GGS56200.1 transcriptional regulator [Streptomyces cinerochromogenes]